MMKKYLISAVFLSLVLAAPAAAEIVEYRDDNISFSYDDEMVGIIEMSRHEKDSVLSLTLLAGTYFDDAASCSLSVAPKDDPPVEETDGIKILQEIDDSYIYLRTSSTTTVNSDEITNQVRTFFDSFSLSPGSDFLVSGNAFDQYVFANIVVSDQGRVYAEEARRILNDYMDMSISNDDAAVAIDKLVTRLSNYWVGSEYFFDYMLYRELSSTSNDLKANEDSKILKTIDVLTMFIGE